MKTFEEISKKSCALLAQQVIEHRDYKNVHKCWLYTINGWFRSIYDTLDTFPESFDETLK